MRTNHRVSKLDLRNQRGYVLVEALLVTVGIGFLAVASISLQDTLTRNQAKVSIHSQLAEMRRMVMENLNNPGVWEQIVQNPENGIKQCLSDSADVCDYRPPKAIGLEVSATTKLYIDPKKPEVGFGMNLEGCDTYKKEDASATACPFQGRMLWQPICTVGGDCKQVEVSVELEADPRFEKLYSFSSESYSFKIKKNVSLKRTEAVPGSRTVSFKADTGAPKAVKVFFVVDNSTSLADNRDALAKGLASFVDGMKGYDVKYYIYTTESSQAAGHWIYPETDPKLIPITSVLQREGGVFTMPDGSKVPHDFSWSLVKDQKFSRWDGRLVLAPDMGAKWGLDLHQEANDPGNGIKATLAKALNDIESPTGSEEGGLCTLAHLLFDDGPNNPIQPGDSAIFMILTDEDETAFSNFGGHSVICPGRIGVRPTDPTGIYKQGCAMGRNAPNCDSAGFAMRAPDKFWKTAYYQWRQKDTLSDDWHDLCESTTPGACGVVGTKASCVRSDIPVATPAGWTWNNKCHTEVATTNEEISWNVEAKDIDGGQFIARKDYCTQSFTHKGITYANIRDFAIKFGKVSPSNFHPSGDCWFYGFTHEPHHHAQFAVLGSDKETDNNMWDYTNFNKPHTDLYNSIPGRLRDLFGTDGYALYTVVHDKDRDTAAGCTMDPDNASYGGKYKKVLLASDTPGNLISVCSENYSSSIEHMRTQAQQIARDNYVLDPFDAATERVYSVQVQRNGAPVNMTKSDYGISGNNVQFKAGFIQGNDQITVVIVPK